MPKTPKPLPPASLHVVLALLDGDQHGYALMRQVDELSDGAVRMGPGTLYGTVNRLVADGLVVETTDKHADPAGDRRRFYGLSPTGRVTAEQELVRLRTLVRRASRRSGPATA